MRRFILAAPLALLWLMTAGVPEATAFESYTTALDDTTTNCAECHGGFRTSPYVSPKGEDWGDDLHDIHRSIMLGPTASDPTNTRCDICHSSGGRDPVFLNSSVGGVGLEPIACVGCHGRNEDATGIGDRGAGLRQHHWNAGEQICAECHDDADPSAFTTVGENVLPSYYAADTGDLYTNKPTNPCNPNGEENFSPTILDGLDNDGDGAYDGDDSDCAGNTPPVADANGPYTGTVGVPVAFDGSGSSDSDGAIVAYDWDFGDGGTGTGVSPSHTYASDGIFTVTLTVTDDVAATDTDSTTATITIGNQAPVADANGPYAGTVGVPVVFDGSGSSDSDGTIVAYDWDFGDGSTGTGVSPSHTYASDGTFSVTLTVTDDGSLTDTASTTATIGPVPNVPPVANADGPYSGTVGVAVLFDGTGSSDSDGTIVAYDWDFGDGSTGTGVSPSHTYASDGTFAVTLMVTDDDGATGTDTTSALIGTVPNEPPVADANGPYVGTVGVAVLFDGSGSSDSDGTIAAYDWDFGDGSVGTGVTPSHAYATDGTFNVTLTVTDDGGLADSDSTTATITVAGPIPPVADANGPYVGTVGVPVQFDGSGSSDPNGTIVSYAWDFGDGDSGSGVGPTHTYAAAGLYNVTLTVTDDEGASDTDSTTANISDVGPMEVDLKVPQAINPSNKGVTPAGFWVDMMDLEIAMVACGPDMAEPVRLHPGDFNNDGFQDVGAKFLTRELGLTCGDEVLICQGTLADGTTFTATSNTFKTVGRECKFDPWAKKNRGHDEDRYGQNDDDDRDEHGDDGDDSGHALKFFPFKVGGKRG